MMTAQAGRNHLAYLRRKLRAARAKVKSPLRELSVALVNDPTMSKLHRDFMNQRGPTDVLTFPLDVDARGTAVAGEIVICVPQAQRRAKIEGNSLRDELLLYAIHGLLHLAGYDDRTKRDFHAMHQKEDMILTELGVGPVFARTRSSPGRRK
jgi:probable rRNA maturation factor